MISIIVHTHCLSPRYHFRDTQRRSATPGKSRRPCLYVTHDIVAIPRNARKTCSLSDNRRADLVAKSVHRRTKRADELDRRVASIKRIRKTRILTCVPPPCPNSIATVLSGKVNNQAHVGVVVKVGAAGHLPRRRRARAAQGGVGATGSAASPHSRRRRRRWRRREPSCPVQQQPAQA